MVISCDHSAVNFNPYITALEYSPVYSERDTKIHNRHKFHNRAMTQRDRTDEPGTQRKRIAVACSRCRQRKIRCSGDNGTGGPCTNCKNAGADMCQFLRVSSEELHNMKSRAYNYNIGSSRRYSSRSPGASPIIHASSMYGDHALAAEVANRSTHNELAYNYNAKLYNHLSGWPSPYGGEHSMSYPDTPSLHQSICMPENYCPDPGSSSRQSNVSYFSSATLYGYGNDQPVSSMDERIPLGFGNHGSPVDGLSTCNSSAIDDSQLLEAVSDRPGSYSVGGFLNSASIRPGYRRTSQLANNLYGESVASREASSQRFAEDETDQPVSIEPSWDNNHASLYISSTSDGQSPRHDSSFRRPVLRPTYSYRYADPFSQRSAMQQHSAMTSPQSSSRHMSYLGGSLLDDCSSHSTTGGSPARGGALSGAGHHN